MMELKDCAFPLLVDMFDSDNPEVAFKDAQIVLLVGSKPRGKGMQRSDLLMENGKIFITQGMALNHVADRNVSGRRGLGRRLRLSKPDRRTDRQT